MRTPSLFGTKKSEPKPQPKPKTEDHKPLSSIKLNPDDPIVRLMNMTRNTMFIKMELDYKYISEHLEFLIEKHKISRKEILSKAEEQIIQLPNLAVIQAMDIACRKINPDNPKRKVLLKRR